MKSSLITSFALSIPDTITKDVFHNSMFSQIACSLPHLRELSLGFPRRDFLPTVVENLFLLPALEKLTFGLSHYGNLHARFPNPKPLRLSNLLSFTGSLDQAAFLFEYPIDCPNLRHLNIILDIYYRGSFSHKTNIRAFSFLNEKFSKMKISPCVSLCFSTWKERPPLQQIARVESEDPDWTRHYLSVSRLTLDLLESKPSGGEETTPFLIREAIFWIGLFRGVNELTIFVCAPLPAWLDSDPSYDQHRASTLSDAVMAQYPKISSLKVVELRSEYSHFHWSNARDEYSRRVEGHTTTIPHKANDICVCSDF
ncbi:hypothetical protein BDZ97DRAFT_1918513 [Flammula alnicola]|nr:hypothetical protein BDZ97DRAFT_1918513 [Flammula alnicola]